MAREIYDWNRYWVPRDGAFSFDDDGFLLAPSKDPAWRRLQRTDALEFSQIEDKPCLVLLGEPGIGKTFALEKERSAPNSFLLSLGPYASEDRLINDLFKGNEFRNWSDNGGEFRLFLDSFDECLLRLDNVAALLAEQLRHLPTVKGLLFRITSRTAEWRAGLEQAMRQVWGDENVGVYELAPLTRDQVHVALEAERIEPKAFINEVVDREVMPFAIKPLTLELLMKIWKKRGGSLPPTQIEIYEQGCLELCSEPNPERDTPQLRRLLTPEQRMAIAGHIASATMFCRRSAIFIGSRPHLALETDLTMSDLAQGEVKVGQSTLPITLQNLRETFDTGLFTARGPDRLGWAHQTYGEFLAARYLEQQNVSTRLIVDLIQHPLEKKLVPQLQETAAWIASNRPQVFEQILKSEPDLLLRSDVGTADDEIKRQLADAIISAASRTDFRGDLWKLRNRYRKLNYAGLAKQLSQKLRNPRLHDTAKIEAVEIIEACNLRTLFSMLAQIAMDVRKNMQLRIASADIVARLGDAVLRRKLKPLALGLRGADQDDDLRGIALHACWPGVVRADELFPKLDASSDRTVSRYALFISNKLVEGLDDRGLPIALKWAETQPQIHHLEHTGMVIQKIMNRAVSALAQRKIRRPFVAALLSRIRHHDYSTGSNAQQLNAAFNADTAVRRDCISIALELFTNPSDDALLVTRWGVGLVQPDDLPWLIAQLLREKSTKEREKIAHVIRFIFYPDNVERIEMVIDAAQHCSELRNLLGFWLDPIELESEEGKRLKADWDREQDWKRQAAEYQKQPPPLVPLPAHRIRKLLDQADSGDVDAWWRVSFWLGIEDNGLDSRRDHGIDIRKLPGWQKAIDSDKRRMVIAADNYLRKHHADPKVWFGKPNVLYRPMLAGLRALLLLSNEDRARFDALPDDVWIRWLPAIAQQQHYDETEEFRFLLATAIKRSPEATTAEILKAIEQENGKDDTLWVLYKLGDEFDAAVGAGLLARLGKSPRLKTKCAAQLLNACIEARVPGALDQARRWIPKKPPRQNHGRTLALDAARLLFLKGTAADWPSLWKLIQADVAFGKMLFERMAHEHHYAMPPLINAISPQDVAHLWEWMLNQYPVAEDPDRSKGGMVTHRWAIADLRDALISSLADRGSLEACQELNRLKTTFPQFEWFDRALTRAKEQTRRNTWEPVSPAQFFKLASNPKTRLVQNADQLMDAVCDALGEVQAKLHGETPAAPFLWNLDRPKEEEATSNWVKIELEALLVSRGIILNREVQIHIKEKTDIHVDAISRENRTDEFGRAKVIIEIKGCWNPDQKTAMQDQLVNRYLAQNDCTQGVFLFGWFLCDSWSRSDPRRRQIKFANRSEAEEYFRAQAARLSTGSIQLRSIVVDATIPSIHRVRRRPGARQTPKTGFIKHDDSVPQNCSVEHIA